MGLKCKCGDYFSKDTLECPSCGAINLEKKLKDEFNARRIAEVTPVFSQKSYIIGKYGKAKWEKHCKAIEEHWSRQRCMEELAMYRLGQIALKNTDIK